MEESDVKQKILITAGQIFATKGFEATKIREICSTAEVNVAAVNYYFGDKEKLYFEAVSYARNNRANENPLPETGADPETRLRQFIKTLVNRTGGMEDPPWEVQLIVREVLFPTEACRRLIEEYFRPFFNQLLSIIEEIAPEPLSSETAYRLGTSIVGQVLYLRFTSRMKTMFLPEQMAAEHFRPEQIAEHVFQFSLASLKSGEFWSSVDDKKLSSTRDSNSTSSNSASPIENVS